MSAPEVRNWLEWAGSNLLALRVRSPAPSGYRSFWPDYADESLAYGWTAETLRAPAPSKFEIPVMDAILLLPSLLTDVNLRVILHKRSLVTPVSRRYVWPYNRLAEELHSDARLVARNYLKGITLLAARVPSAQIRTFRQFTT